MPNPLKLPVLMTFCPAGAAGRAGGCEGMNDAAPVKHACPYRADVNNDPTPVCTCCADCTQECRNDV